MMGEKIASLYAEISADTSKLDRSLKNTSGGLKGFASDLNNTVKQVTGFDLASLSVVGALTGVAAGISKAINETVEYTKTIRDMTYFTGESAEEISRIVQVADDWGVGIGQVQTALRYLTKNGIQPNINSLAKLADEYVSTTNKTEFAAKAAKLLGREWTTLIPVLQQGGDSLRKQAEQVDKNLIVTDKMIGEARDYELALDAWHEQSEKLVYHWGSELLPKGAAVLELMTELTSLDAKGWFEEGANASAKFINKVVYGKETIEDFNVAASRFVKDDQVARVFDDMGDSADTAATKIQGVVRSLNEVTASSMASDALAAVNKAFEDGLISQSEYDKLTHNILDNFTELPEKEIAIIQNMGYLNKAMQDGTLAAGDYVAIITNLGIAWSKIPRDVTTTYHINYKKAEYGPEPGPGAPVIIPPGPDVPGPTPQSNSPTSITINQTFNDTGAAALGMAYVESLRSKRLDAGMGV